jgi:DnaJ-domain-containing protein 1
VTIFQRLSRLAKANVNTLLDRLRSTDGSQDPWQEQEKQFDARLREAERSVAKKDPRLARYYGQLELPYGADLAQVKRAYRRLMRRYHPDRHSVDAQKQKIATELTQALTHAYHQLESALQKDQKDHKPTSTEQDGKPDTAAHS